MKTTFGELKNLLDSDMVKLLKIVDKHQFSGADIVSLLLEVLEEHQDDNIEFFNDVCDLNDELEKE